MNKLLRKITALLIVATMMLGTSALAKDYAQKFWDVPKTYWGFEYIADLAERGVIKGYEDGSFKPEATVSRSEWAKMMVDAAGLQANDNKVYFTDTQGHWANKYINAASNYLLAYTDGSYRPDQAATREDVTVAMVKLKGYNTSDVDYSYLNFRDNDSISNYAKGYVAVAIKNNLITGFEDNTFRGQDTLTRAEAATLMYRAFKLGNADKVTETSPKTEIKVDDSRKSDSDYVKQAEPKYQEPEEETKTPSKTENTKKDNTKNDDVVKEEPKDEEPEEEPEPVKKPYVVDTLVKAKGVTSFTDDGETIYYTNGSKISSVGIDSGDEESLANTDDFEIDNDEMTLSDFEIVSICWDNTRSGLLVAGKYNKINSAGNVNNSYLYLIKEDGKIEKLTDNFPWLRIKGVLENGDFIAAENTKYPSENDNRIIDSSDYTEDDSISYGIVNTGIALYPSQIYLEKGNKIFYLSKSYWGSNEKYAALMSFNFSDAEELWNVTNEFVNAAAVTADKVIYFGDYSIKICNYSGKELNKINIDDIEISDKKGISFSSVEMKLIISNDNIIFYDNSAKAFRIITENN